MPRWPEKEARVYSTNKHTVRARKRAAGLPQLQRELELAKSADSRAVIRAWKLKTDTEAFQMASQADKSKVLEQVEKEVLQRRRLRGIDQETRLSRYMKRHHLTGDDSVPKPPSPRPASPVRDPDVSFHPPPGAPDDFRPSTISDDFDTTCNRLFSCEEEPRTAPELNIDHTETIPYFEDYLDRLPLHPCLYEQGDVGNNTESPTVTSVVSTDNNTSTSEVDELKHQVQCLSVKLGFAQTTISLMEDRIKAMESRVAKYDALGSHQHVSQYAQATSTLAEGCRSIGQHFAVLSTQLDPSAGAVTDDKM
ncbi:hypothetical protein GGS23DRAFT_598848 [Durotheca rogersii]|uniref:uncharacterized protein n=1 Tax=Durotheca rogersii TaxID=419775 RepID=UPI00221E63E5|nr:uncharacterized protein GGS23DRAFT_598848 [Durotheca rogersii]KAI5860961.1 hypothetical protein GGS23DRAFT_598848 [Durotheca rogersii]